MACIGQAETYHGIGECPPESAPGYFRRIILSQQKREGDGAEGNEQEADGKDMHDRLNFGIFEIARNHAAADEYAKGNEPCDRIGNAHR